MDERLYFLAIVPALLWAGVFFYMLTIDRKLARLEADTEEDDL